MTTATAKKATPLASVPDGKTVSTEDKAKHLDAVKRSQKARKEAVDMLIAAHKDEFTGYWATTKAANGISDREAKREAKEKAEFERLAAKFGK